MSIYKGNKKVIALYKGATPIKSVMKGTLSIFGSEGGGSDEPTIKGTVITATYNDDAENCVSIDSNSICKTGNVCSWDISEWGKEKLTNCYKMFYLTDITTLNEFPDTSEVYHFGQMFQYCSNLTSLDLSGWNTSKVFNTGMMFSNCSLLEYLNVTGWDVSLITSNYVNMFGGCISLKTLVLGNVTQEQYDWWYARLSADNLQNQVTIEYTIIE